MIDVRTIGSSSAGNGYLIRDGMSPLLIECGLPIRRLQAGSGYTLSGVAGCLVSHEHGDHSRSARDLMRLGVTCYMSAGTAEALGLEKQYRLRILRDRVETRITHWTILPFGVVHDAADPMGFALDTGYEERLLFLTDTAYSPYRFDNLTHIMVECNYRDEDLEQAIGEGRTHPAQGSRLLETHFGLSNVVQMLKANDLSRVRGIWLMHLSDAHGHETEMKLAVQRATGCPVYICPK